MDEIEKFFYGILTTIHISWDPDKDNSATGPDREHHYLPPRTLEKQITFCRQETITPVTLFRSLEELFRRVDLAKPGSPAVGPSGRDLSQDIRETKDALLGMIKGLISMLSHLLVSLTNTVASLDYEKHDVLYGRTSNHRDSIETKIERLKLQMRK